MGREIEEWEKYECLGWPNSQALGSFFLREGFNTSSALFFSFFFKKKEKESGHYPTYLKNKKNG
jgi:hypothetical protein